MSSTFEEHKGSDTNNLLSSRISGVSLNQSTLLQKELEQREHLENLQ